MVYSSHYFSANGYSMTTKVRNLTCIVCPKGCDLAVLRDADGILIIKGNECEHGHVYALEEMTAPVRVLTTTVALRGGRLPLLPVRSSAPLPRERLMACMEVIAGVVATPPLGRGAPVVRYILGTGVDMVATRRGL